MSKDEEGPCPDCDGKGWLHMGDPFEIQADNSCQSLRDDSEAVSKHTADCGCDWPPFDYHNNVTRWIGWLEGDYPSETVAKLHELAVEREDFVKNLDQMLLLVGQLVDEAIGDRKVDQHAWGYVQCIAINLLRLKFHTTNKTYQPRWFFTVDDGVVLENGGWRAP